MAHHRQAIRDAVTTAVTGLTTTGTRVFKSRKYPLQEAELPGLLVYALTEEATPITLGYPRYLDRVLTVRVVGVAKANASLDTTLDNIAAEVETALAADYTLGGLVIELHLANTELMMQTINDEEISDKPIGVVALDWSVLYRTIETTPGTGV